MCHSNILSVFVIHIYLFRYDYFAVQDVDEVITPRKHNNWAEMMADLEKEASHIRSSFVFQNVYFLDNMQELFG